MSVFDKLGVDVEQRGQDSRRCIKASDSVNRVRQSEEDGGDGGSVSRCMVKRTKWHMSRNVRKTWFVSVIKRGRVRMARYPELDDPFPVEVGDSDVWSIP